MSRKRKGLFISINNDAADDAMIQEFKKFKSENKLQEHKDTLKYLLERNRSEFFYERLECNDYSEYPPDPKHFIQCSRGCGKHKKPRIRTRKDCQICAYENNKIVKVFIKNKEKWEQDNIKLEQENVKFEEKKLNLTTEIDMETKKLEDIENLASMPAQLKKKDKEIADLKKDFETKLKREKEVSQEESQELRQKIRYLEDYVNGAEKQKTIEGPYRPVASNVENCGAQSKVEVVHEKIPQSVREAVKSLSEQKPLVPESHNEQRSKPVQTVTQRVTEREKTEKEKIVEIVISDPFVNQEILCPNKGNYVSIVNECKKSCSDYVVCPYWEEIYAGKLPQNATVRLRET